MNWNGCKNILCIRPDNMGDLIMSAPAIRALKETFGASITVLTSSMAKGIIKHIPEIDDAIIFDLPWVKTSQTPDAAMLNEVVSQIKDRKFDAAVLFTVFSQNPLPTTMLAYLAGIPRILAYCRENPYHLITDWVPDIEPYTCIKHQVTRDLDLVRKVGANTANQDLFLSLDQEKWAEIASRLEKLGVNLHQPWLILHPGVSEIKRAYPVQHWAEAGKKLRNNGYQLLLTGSAAETPLTDELQRQIGEGSYAVAGMFDLEEFICLVKNAPLMVSVNTGTVHIAAAVQTKVVVLYAQTNPQHTPWQVPHRILEFPVSKEYQSKNEVIAFLNRTVYQIPAAMPAADDIVNAVGELINLPDSPVQLSHGIPNESREIATS